MAVYINGVLQGGAFLEVGLEKCNLIAVGGTWGMQNNNNQEGYYVLRNSSHGNGEYCLFKMYIPAGTYTMTTCGVKSTNYPIVVISIDGTDVQSSDWYNAVELDNQLVITTGIVIATSSEKSIKVRVSNKNASSTDYYVSISSIILKQTG